MTLNEEQPEGMMNEQASEASAQIGGRRSRRGGRKSRRGGRKSRRGGRKSRRGGRKSRRGGMKSRSHKKKSKSHRRKSHRGGMVHGAKKSHRTKKLHKKSRHQSAGKRRTCPKYCRRKTVRCKSYRRVHRRHGKSHRRR